MRRTASIALAGVLAFNLTTTAAHAADPTPQRVSKFIGYVDCGGQRLAFDLVLNGGDRGNLPGVLSLKQVGKPVRSYRVRGSIDNAGTFRLAPVAWIAPSKLWPMIQVQGATKPDGTVVAGGSTTKGCTKSGVVLTSDDGILPVLSAAYSVQGAVRNPSPLVLPTANAPAPAAKANATPAAAPQAQAPRALPAGVPRPPSGERTRLTPGGIMIGGVQNKFDPYTDYPSRALRQEAGGSHHVRLTVGADGRALSCDILSEQGEPGLAANSCNLLVRRARFRIPDKPGVPVSGTWVGYLVYRSKADESMIRAYQID